MVTLRRFELEALLELITRELGADNTADHADKLAVMRISESENEDVIRIETETESGDLRCYKLG